MNLNGKFGAFFINNELRYLSRQSVTEYEDLNAFQGRAPQNQDYASINYYPEVLYLNTRIGINIDKNSLFYFGIDNVTDRLPPLSSTGIGGGTGIYDNKGRYFYSGINVRF